MLRAALLLIALVLPAQAEEVVAGLSQSRISIATNFDGSEILIFGAVKRTTPADDAPLQVLITVEGPSEPLTVRKKDKRFGIWINTDQVEVTAPQPGEIDQSLQKFLCLGPGFGIINGTDNGQPRIPTVHHPVGEQNGQIQVGELHLHFPVRAHIRYPKIDPLPAPQTSILMLDKDRNEIPARLAERDYELYPDDTINFYLDTYNDNRKAYFFSTNPLGVEQDGLISENGDNLDLTWDGIFEVAAKINKYGWIAEFSIPYKTLRFQDNSLFIMP